MGNVNGAVGYVIKRTVGGVTTTIDIAITEDEYVDAHGFTSDTITTYSVAAMAVGDIVGNWSEDIITTSTNNFRLTVTTSGSNNVLTWKKVYGAKDYEINKNDGYLTHGQYNTYSLPIAPVGTSYKIIAYDADDEVLRETNTVVL